MKKILYFEGAGCVEAGGNSDIPNCRIRTAFTNNEGKKIYLELTRWVVEEQYDHKKLGRYKEFKAGTCLGFVDSCHYITDDAEIDDCNASNLRFSGKNYMLVFTYAELLKFINELLNCSFDEIKVLNKLTGYRVFSDKCWGTFAAYNYGDEFPYDDEKTQKRLAKKAELKEYFEQFMQYDNSSYWVAENGNLMVRINTYDKDFKRMKFKERQFEVEI